MILELQVSSHPGLQYIGQKDKLRNPLPVEPWVPRFMDGPRLLFAFPDLQGFVSYS